MRSTGARSHPQHVVRCQVGPLGLRRLGRPLRGVDGVPIIVCIGVGCQHPQEGSCKETLQLSVAKCRCGTGKFTGTSDNHLHQANRPHCTLNSHVVAAQHLHLPHCRASRSRPPPRHTQTPGMPRRCFMPPWCSLPNSPRMTGLPSRSASSKCDRSCREHCIHEGWHDAAEQAGDRRTKRSWHKCWARDMHVRTQRIVQSRLQSSLQRSHESGYMCSCIRSTLLPCDSISTWVPQDILQSTENCVGVNHHGMACMHQLQLAS